MSYHIYMFQELPHNCSRNSIRVQWPSCNAHWAFLLASHCQMVMTRSSNIHFSPQTPSFHKLTVHFQFISRGLVSRVTPIPFYPGVGRVWPCSFYSPTCRGLFCIHYFHGVQLSNQNLRMAVRNSLQVCLMSSLVSWKLSFNCNWTVDLTKEYK